jgi:hypothetical protein
MKQSRLVARSMFPPFKSVVMGQEADFRIE